MTEIGHITETDDKPGLSIGDSVQLAIASKGVGAEFTALDIVEMLDGAANVSQVSTALAHLRNKREETGIIRVSQGVYAFRPDNLDLDIGDKTRESNKTDSYVEKVFAIYKSHPGQPLNSRDIQNMLDPGADLSIRQIGQAISNIAGKEPALARVSPGRYVYETGRIGMELEGIGDKIPDSVLIGAGLKVVARAQDGSRVAVDEDGVAWLISIRVEGRLL